jgi:hypothetical protein
MLPTSPFIKEIWLGTWINICQQQHALLLLLVCLHEVHYTPRHSPSLRSMLRSRETLNTLACHSSGTQTRHLSPSASCTPLHTCPADNPRRLSPSHPAQPSTPCFRPPSSGSAYPQSQLGTPHPPILRRALRSRFANGDASASGSSGCGWSAWGAGGCGGMRG